MLLRDGVYYSSPWGDLKSYILTSTTCRDRPVRLRLCTGLRDSLQALICGPQSEPCSSLTAEGCMRARDVG